MAETEREELLEVFDSICPNIVGNPFIPHWPTPPQQFFLGLHLSRPPQEQGEVFEALYGGAAGGGKSDALLMAAAQYAWKYPEFAGVCFRRTHTDLAQPGALMDRAMQWWVPQGVHWNGSDKIFTFPSGAKVAMAYLNAPNDHLRYQGAEYQGTFWDELTQHPTDMQYRYVALSRVRRHEGSQIPLRSLSASNPGGPGHVWVDARLVGTDEPPTLPGRFVPALIQDNPHLDRDAYVAGLMGLHPTVRAQLLRGDWRARDPGDYFQAIWFGALLDPETDRWTDNQCNRIRWWDLAASEKPDASKTAGVLMARNIHGVRAVEHCRSGRWVPGKRDDIIIQTAQADGQSVVVGIEIEGGSGGLAQFLTLENRLKAKGFRVAGARPRADLTNREAPIVVRQSESFSAKAGRADPVAGCLYNGYLRRGEAPRTDENEDSPYWGVDMGKNERDGIRLFAGPWTQSFLDSIEGFPPETGKEGVDEVDAMSGAWAWTEAHPLITSQFGRAKEKPQDMGEQHDTHPEMRTERKGDKDRAGRWKP